MSNLKDWKIESRDEPTMKSSEIVRLAKEYLPKSEFTCNAVFDACEACDDPKKYKEIQQRINRVLDLQGLTLNSRMERLGGMRFYYARNNRGYINYMLFARQKLCDFLIEQYEAEGD